MKSGQLVSSSWWRSRGSQNIRGTVEREYLARLQSHQLAAGDVQGELEVAQKVGAQNRKADRCLKKIPFEKM